MSYEKHELLGTNKDGSRRMDGRVKSPHPTADTMPISHDHSRDFERIANTGNIARDTSKQSAKCSTVRVHDGMHFRDREGALNVGVTHQQVVNAPDASGASPLDPTVTKQITPAKPVVGMRSRATAHEVGALAPGVAHRLGTAAGGLLHDIRHIIGRAVTDEAIEAGGPDHPAKLGKRPLGR